MRPGDRLDLPGGGALRVVPAVHAVHPRDGYSEGGDPPRFVGYVLEVDGVAIYHGGDTIADDRVLAGLDGVRVDVALLPVNGRTSSASSRTSPATSTRATPSRSPPTAARASWCRSTGTCGGQHRARGRRRGRGGRGRRAGARADAQPRTAVGRGASGLSTAPSDAEPTAAA